MKVWLVRSPSDPYEPWAVEGVFSTREKAEEYEREIKEKDSYPGATEIEIEEWEIDTPHSFVRKD